MKHQEAGIPHTAAIDSPAQQSHSSDLMINLKAGRSKKILEV
jgi:hypothetical protein